MADPIGPTPRERIAMPRVVVQLNMTIHIPASEPDPLAEARAYIQSLYLRWPSIKRVDIIQALLEVPTDHDDRELDEHGAPDSEYFGVD